MTCGVQFLFSISVDTVFRKEMSEKNLSNLSAMFCSMHMVFMKRCRDVFATLVERGSLDRGFMKRKSSSLAPSLSLLHVAKFINLVATQYLCFSNVCGLYGTWEIMGAFEVFVLPLIMNT